MPNTLMLVFTRPVSPDREAEYNEWYSKKHLPDLVRVPGVVAATRYSLADAHTPEGAPPGPRDYLAAYEIDGARPENIQDFWAALYDSLAHGGVDASQTLDFPNITACFAVPITERITREAVLLAQADPNAAG